MKQRVLSLLMLAALCAMTAATVAAAEPAGPGVVNINTASAEQLQLLPRVGPALAGRIISFREANGPFRSSDELVAVKGIGERSLEKLKPYLTIEGKTTLADKVKLPRGARSDDAS